IVAGEMVAPTAATLLSAGEFNSGFISGDNDDDFGSAGAVRARDAVTFVGVTVLATAADLLGAAGLGGEAIFACAATLVCATVVGAAAFIGVAALVGATVFAGVELGTDCALLAKDLAGASA